METKQIKVIHSTERKEYMVTVNGNNVVTHDYRDADYMSQQVAEDLAKIAAFDCAANEQFPVEILYTTF